MVFQHRDTHQLHKHGLGQEGLFHILVEGKIYMISVDQAVDGNMNLRFKSAGVIHSNGRQSWRVSYEEAVNSGVNYWWAEDYRNIAGATALPTELRP